MSQHWEYETLETYDEGDVLMEEDLENKEKEGIAIDSKFENSFKEFEKLQISNNKEDESKVEGSGNVKDNGGDGDGDGDDDGDDDSYGDGYGDGYGDDYGYGYGNSDGGGGDAGGGNYESYENGGKNYYYLGDEEIDTVFTDYSIKNEEVETSPWSPYTYSSPPPPFHPDFAPSKKERIIKKNFDFIGFLNNPSTVNNEGAHLSIEKFGINSDRQNLFFFVQNEELGTINIYPINNDQPSTPITHYCLTKLFPTSTHKDISSEIKFLQEEIRRARNILDSKLQSRHNKKLFLKHNSLRNDQHGFHNRLGNLLKKLGSERMLRFIRYYKSNTDPSTVLLKFRSAEDKRRFIKNFNSLNYNNGVGANFFDYLIKSKQEFHKFLRSAKKDGVVKKVQIFDGKFKISFAGSEDVIHHVDDKKQYEELKRKWFVPPPIKL